MKKNVSVLATMEVVGILVKAQITVTPTRVAKNLKCSYSRASKNLQELHERNFLVCHQYGYRKNVLAKMYSLTINGERLMLVLDESPQQELPF